MLKYVVSCASLGQVKAGPAGLSGPWRATPPLLPWIACPPTFLCLVPRYLPLILFLSIFSFQCLLCPPSSWPPVPLLGFPTLSSQILQPPPRQLGSRPFPSTPSPILASPALASSESHSHRPPHTPCPIPPRWLHPELTNVNPLFLPHGWQAYRFELCSVISHLISSLLHPPLPSSMPHTPPFLPWGPAQAVPSLCRLNAAALSPTSLPSPGDGERE